MHQQLWGYKVEEKLYVGVREQKRLNTTVLEGFYNVHGQMGHAAHKKKPALLIPSLIKRG
jgi:hypothetical protein